MPSPPSTTWEFDEAAPSSAFVTDTTDVAIPSNPVDFLLDADGDIVIDSQLRFVSGLDAVVQACKYRLGLFRGEWFADLEVGIPYHQEILWQDFDAAKIRSIYRSALLSVPDVNGIVSLEVNFDSSVRTVSTTFRVSSIFGVTPEVTVEREV